MAMATSTATTIASCPSNSLPLVTPLTRNGSLFNLIQTSRRRAPSLQRRNYSKEVDRYSYSCTRIRPFSPVMEWQDCTVRKEVALPVSVAYNCYSDREAISRWMPFISSVKVLEDKPDLSRWALKYTAFGRDIEFSWLSRNMQSIPNQKIHWRSLEGLPNRGAVRFYPKGPTSCTIELTVSYEVPQILVPVASALQPLIQKLLMGGLDRFVDFAKSYYFLLLNIILFISTSHCFLIHYIVI